MPVNDNVTVNKSNNFYDGLAYDVLHAERQLEAIVKTIAERLVMAPRKFIGEQTPDGRIINLKPVPEERDQLTEAEEACLAHYRGRVRRAQLGRMRLDWLRHKASKNL